MVLEIEPAGVCPASRCCSMRPARPCGRPDPAVGGPRGGRDHRVPARHRPIAGGCGPLGRRAGSIPLVKPGVVEAAVTFAGAPFRHYQQIDRYDPASPAGRSRRISRFPSGCSSNWRPAQSVADSVDPGRLPQHLAGSGAPAPVRADRGPGRPVDGIAENRRSAGRTAEGVRLGARLSRRNFTGFYADLSRLSADVAHTLELDVPAGMKAGQFQGVFFENVETEYRRAVTSDHQLRGGVRRLLPA